MRSLLARFLTCPLGRVGTFTIRVHDAAAAIVAVLVSYLSAATMTPGVFGADNTFLTIAMITREALVVLENELTFTKRVNRQFDSSFGVDGAKIGDTLNVRKPPRYTIRVGQSMDPQDMTETQVPVRLDTQLGVDMGFSSSDLKLKIDDFSKRFIQPAISQIANEIDRRGMALYNQIYQAVGTPGTVPADALTYLNASVLLSNSSVPMAGRAMVLNPRMQAILVDALKGLFQQSTAIAAQYEKGQMGTALGWEFYMDQNVAVHTVGTYLGTPLMNGTTLNGATSVVTDGWTSGTSNLNKGDIFTIGGVYSVNLMSRASTGQLQQFVVTTGVNDTTGNMTISVSPALIATGQFQTVDALPLDGAAITVLGASGTVTPQALGFTRDAFTLVTADLPVPNNQEMAGRASDKQLGISIRMIRDYTIATDQYPCRLDVLLGWSVLRPECAVRVAS